MTLYQGHNPDSNDKETNDSEVPGLHRIYLYKNYSYHRIKRIFRDSFNIEMVYINQGYKANRRPGYCERYDLVEADTREVVAKYVTLDQCRRVLAYYYDFPEEDEYSAGNTPHERKRREFNKKLEELREMERLNNEKERS